MDEPELGLALLLARLGSLAGSALTADTHGQFGHYSYALGSLAGCWPVANVGHRGMQLSSSQGRVTSHRNERKDGCERNVLRGRLPGEVHRFIVWPAGTGQYLV